MVAVSREFRWLARELRPAPARHRSVVAVVAGVLLRYLPEIVAGLGLVWLWAALADVLGDRPAAVVLVAVGGLLVWWAPSRRVLAAVAGCVVTRHRLRTALVELRLTSRAGRLPLVLWLGPTPVGEGSGCGAGPACPPRTWRMRPSGSVRPASPGTSGSPGIGGGPPWSCWT